VAVNPVPLIFVRPGSRVRIVELNAGFGLRRRLLQLGLAPGEVIEIIQNYGLVIIVRLANGITLALSKGIAQKIYVELLV